MFDLKENLINELRGYIAIIGKYWRVDILETVPTMNDKAGRLMLESASGALIDNRRISTDKLYKVVMAARITANKRVKPGVGQRPRVAPKVKV